MDEMNTRIERLLERIAEDLTKIRILMELHEGAEHCDILYSGEEVRSCVDVVDSRITRMFGKDLSIAGEV